AGKNVRAYRVKVLGVDFGNGGGQVSDGLALDLDAGAEVIVFHGRVAGDAHLLDTGKLMEAGFDGAIESFYLPLAVPGGLRIDVDDVAVFRFEFEIGVLELAQAFREQSRAQKEDERQGGLKNDESALENSCASGGRARAAAQGIGGGGFWGEARGRPARRDGRVDWPRGVQKPARR